MDPAARPGAGDRIVALLRVLLLEALRRGRSGEGLEVRPLRQVLFASTLLGVFGAIPLRHEAPLYWVQALCLYAAFYTALAVVPDTQDVFEKRRDLLGPLPLRPLEAAAARIGFLFVIVVLLVVPLALPSLLWLGARGAFAPLQLVGVGLALLGVGLTVAGSWLYFAFVVGRRIGIEPLRKAASLLMSLLIAGTSIFGAAELWTERSRGTGFAAEALAALPTSWYAAPWVEPASAASGWKAAGALVALAAAVLLAARTDPTLAYAAGAAPRRERDSWVGRGLARLDRRRSATAVRRLLPLVLFLSRVWSRDAFTALRVRAFAASAVALLVVSAVWSPTSLAMPISIAVLGFMALGDGALDLAMSSEAEAVWLLQVSPIASADLVAAMRTVVLAERGIVAAVALGVATALEHGVTSGLAIAPAFLGAGYLLVSAVQLVRPRRPFAQQASAARGSAAIWVASPLAMVGALLFSPALAVALLPVGVDLLFGAALAATLYAFGRAFGIAAAGPQARLRA